MPIEVVPSTQELRHNQDQTSLVKMMVMIQVKTMVKPEIPHSLQSIRQPAPSTIVTNHQAAPMLDPVLKLWPKMDLKIKRQTILLASKKWWLIIR
jgi:hypothetical protein